MSAIWSRRRPHHPSQPDRPHGSTGRSTATHLHYEVRIDGRAVKPDPVHESTIYVLAMQRRSGVTSMDAVGVGGPVAGQR